MGLTIGIFGTGGFGREVIDWAGDTINIHPADDETLVFVTTDGGGPVNGVLHYSEAEFAALPGEKQLAIAVADPRIREAVARRMSANCRPATLISLAARVGSTCAIGGG